MAAPSPGQQHRAGPQQPGPAPSAAPRLVITQMVLENFKSYAGAQVVGPFHKARAGAGGDSCGQQNGGRVAGRRLSWAACQCVA